VWRKPLFFGPGAGFSGCNFVFTASNQRRVAAVNRRNGARGGVLPQFHFPCPVAYRLEEYVMAKKSGSKPMTKTEIMRSISETTNLPKKDVVAVMEALTDEIQKALKGSGIGVFSIPGLVKIERRKVPARPAQKGVKNPFTGELQDRPAKPASVKVRVRALKNLKAMVSG
jgi:nucleoid DNA-binding protein